jgi:hypothetical protein
MHASGPWPGRIPPESALQRAERVGASEREAHGSEDRLKLLRLLFVNVGLREVVRLLPEERWREALDAVYRGGR